MIAKLLEIQNFMGIGNGSLSFKAPGLILIEGVNNSSPTSKSNGASKSTIYEAMHWCLWGTTKRGIKGDDVVNNKSKKNCSVSFWFDDFLVVRKRKDAKEKNSLRVFRVDSSCAVIEELTKGTMPETQVLISELIGMSEMTFSKVAHFGQGDIKQFASLSDREFKQVFEESMGLTFFSDDLAKIKEEKKSVEEKSSGIRSEILSISERDIPNTKVHLESIKTNISAWEDMRSDTIKRLESDISVSKAQIENFKETIASIAGDREEDKVALKKVSDSIDQMTLLRSQLAVKINDIRGKLAREQSDWEGHLRQIETGEQNLKKADKKVGTPCPTCSRPFRYEDISGLVESIRKSIESHGKLAESRRESVDELSASLNGLTDLMGKLEEKISAAGHEKAAISSRLTGEALTKSLTMQLEHAQKTLQNALRAREDAQAMENPHRPTLAAVEANLSEIEASLADKHALLAPLDEKLTLLSMLEDALGNGGLKSYVFDSVTPELNRLIHEHMRVLDDIEIEVSTLKKLKTGEVREKFDISVTNKHGAEVYAGNSGGEKQKINLALSMAFNALVRSIASSSLNFIFLDEVFESLDSGSSEPVMELCKSLSSEIPHVFIITHQPHIKELVDDVLTVEKTGKKATFNFV